jgi:hypothetical protein
MNHLLDAIENRLLVELALTVETIRSADRQIRENLPVDRRRHAR